jgi:phenylalanine-4-hydroxylase
MVTHRDRVLFHPSWGIYDMAVGKSVESAFSGIADPNAYDFSYEIPKEKTHKIHYGENELKLFSYYEKVNRMRRNKDPDLKQLSDIFSILCEKYPKDWLLGLEIYELIYRKKNDELTEKVQAHLEKLSANPSYKNLIQDGIQLLHKELNSN